MSDQRDVSPINLLTGMTVLSLESGNKLGEVRDSFIDPINGVLLGLTVALVDGSTGALAYNEIYSFGRDAVMARTDQSLIPLESEAVPGGEPASKLIGTKIITERGDVMGQITDVFVTLKPPPRIIYEGRQSIIDKLLGREFYIPASAGHALSDDATRVLVPDVTSELATSDLADLVARDIEVRSFEPPAGESRQPYREDDTILIDEDETIVRFSDDDDTVLRIRGDRTA